MFPENTVDAPFYLLPPRSSHRPRSKLTCSALKPFFFCWVHACLTGDGVGDGDYCILPVGPFSRRGGEQDGMIV